MGKLGLFSVAEVKNKFIDIVSENAEVALDLLLEDGVLKDIPILGNVVKIYGCKVTYRTFYMRRNLKLFFRPFQRANMKKLKWTK